MKTFKDFINEEGYDRLRDQGRVRPFKDKKDATTMPVVMRSKRRRRSIRVLLRLKLSKRSMANLL